VNRPEAKEVRPGGHVHDDVLVRPVDEVVEEQFDRADLGVVAGDPQVLGGEGAGHREPDPADLTDHRVVDRVGPGDGEQPRTTARRGGLDHRRRRGNPRVLPPQVLLDLDEVVTERR
jgi:hypothetical protein